MRFDGQSQAGIKERNVFTGLIQTTGEFIALKKSGESARLQVRCGPWNPPLAVGESVAVDGACLTVVEFDGATATFDVLAETLEKTCLGDKNPGATLNLERALRLGEALGGHIVTGHVDGVGTLRSMEKTSRDWKVTVTCSSGLLDEMVPKGSVALNGISLTIVDLTNESFAVHIIPHTWAMTGLSKSARGDKVNIETDVLGKYVRRMNSGEKGKSPITWDLLKKAGYG